MWKKIEKFNEMVDLEKSRFLAHRSKYVSSDTDPFDVSSESDKLDPLQAIADGKADEQLETLRGAPLLEYASSLGLNPQDLNLIGFASIPRYVSQHQINQPQNPQNNQPNTNNSWGQQNSTSNNNSNQNKNSSNPWGQANNNTKSSGGYSWGGSNSSLNSNINNNSKNNSGTFQW